MELVSLLSSLSSLENCDEESLRSGGGDRSFSTPPDVMFSCRELLVLEPSGGMFLNCECASGINDSFGKETLGC